MDQPFFSIIIPTLNEEHFLPLLLRNLEEQTYGNYEVIIIDAHSEDETLKKAKLFVNKLPNLIILHSDHRNVSYQRNSAAKSAAGKYLIFFDADVKISKTYLQELHEKIQEKGYPFITTLHVNDPEHPEEKGKVGLTNFGLELSKVIGIPCATGGNFIIEKQLFYKMGGFREDIKMAEDFELTLRLKKEGVPLKILKAPRLVFSYRRWRNEGTFALMQKYFKTHLHQILKGPITEDIVEYEMGGHVYNKKHLRDKQKSTDSVKPGVIDKILKSLREEEYSK